MKNHKNTWNNFTKFVLWGTCRGYYSFSFNGYLPIVESTNENCFCFLENQKIEKELQLHLKLQKIFIIRFRGYFM